jgi:hypothetical protein
MMKFKGFKNVGDGLQLQHLSIEQELVTDEDYDLVADYYAALSKMVRRVKEERKINILSPKE